MREYQKLPLKKGKLKSISGIYGVVSFVFSVGFGLWATLKLMNWFVPNETVASSWRRLAETILFLPAYLILSFLVWVFFMFLMIVFVKILNVKPDTADNSEEVDLNPDAVSAWPYWLMAIFFGSVYLFALFLIGQDMMIRHFPGEDWVIVFFMTTLLGAPAMIGILRIRQLGKGVKVESFSYRPASSSLQKGSPAFQKTIIGIIFCFFAGLAILFGYQTIQFQKTAVQPRVLLNAGLTMGLAKTDIQR